MNSSLRFIIVDDDPLNNSLCKFVIKSTYPDAEVVDFILPKEGIAYISSNYKKEKAGGKTVLLLDINMPVLNGWDFLERFDALDPHIKSVFTVYILSSSVDWLDKQRAAESKHVLDYLIKPLTKKTVEQILAEFDLA